jgi:hypothetical protein
MWSQIISDDTIIELIVMIAMETSCYKLVEQLLTLSESPLNESIKNSLIEGVQKFEQFYTLELNEKTRRMSRMMKIIRDFMEKR